MVRKKIKSKRLGTAYRERVAKKARHKSKKAKRDAKRHPSVGRSAKDPGIPVSLPFRDEVMEEAIEAKEAQMEEKKARRRVPGGQFKEFGKVLAISDVVLHVLDARDPMGTRSRQVEDQVLASGKRMILVLNKSDLVPQVVKDQWLKYLQAEFPTVCFERRRDCAENLVSMLKAYCLNAGIKTSISVGVVGFPNVGKSTLINVLKRGKACVTGSVPGITRVAQEVCIDSKIRLIDSPGVVTGRAGDDELRNCVAIEKMEDPAGVASLIVAKCTQADLMNVYGIGEFDGVDGLLSGVARRLGRLRKGGVPDLEQAARTVVRDWNTGKIPFHTLPPARDEEVAIVNQWGQEFSLA